MKRFLLILSLLLTFGLSGQAALAQTDASTPEMSGMSLTDVEGLNSAYMRTYSVDFMALMSTPNADMSDTAALMRSVSVQALTFDSDDAAKDFLKQQLDDVDASLEQQTADMGEVEKSDVKIEDTDATQLTITMEDAGIAMTYVIFVDGDTVFLVSSIDADADAATKLATDTATFILKADDSDADVTFSEDGTSTGGVFDRMPAPGDDAVGGLTSVMDMDLMAAQ